MYFDKAGSVNQEGRSADACLPGARAGGASGMNLALKPLSMEEAFSLDSNSSVKEFLPVHFGTMMRLFLSFDNKFF
jgi:hypothetical protein